MKKETKQQIITILKAKYGIPGKYIITGLILIMSGGILLSFTKLGYLFIVFGILFVIWDMLILINFLYELSKKTKNIRKYMKKSRRK
jgi:hypothetical protein